MPSPCLKLLLRLQTSRVPFQSMSPRAHSRTNLSPIAVQGDLFSFIILVSIQGFYEDTESIGIAYTVIANL